MSGMTKMRYEEGLRYVDQSGMMKTRLAEQVRQTRGMKIIATNRLAILLEVLFMQDAEIQ